MSGMIDSGANALSTVAVTKGVATAGTCVGLLGVNEWGWAAAVVGSFFAVYLEGSRKPSEVVQTIIEILAWAFAAALAAVAIGHFHWFGIDKFAGQVPLGVRAGIFGLSVRWVVLTGKGVLAQKAKGWSEK